MDRAAFASNISIGPESQHCLLCPLTYKVIDTFETLMMCPWLMPTQKFLMLLKMLKSVFIGNSSMTFGGLATTRSILLENRELQGFHLQ